jgi:hypothetical protein
VTVSPDPADLQPQDGGSAHRSPRSWVFFRIVLGLSGAALVLFPVASGNGYIFSVVGLVMFVTAILFFPRKERATLEEKARELGAVAVVDGGRYRLPNSSSSVHVKLLVAADRISALDEKFRVLLEIPSAEITSFLALQGEKGWFLEVVWTTQAVEFSFTGTSAERRVHEAENAIRSVKRAAAPEVPQRRASGA